ncbi:MAG: putative PEP-binding protein, partial [Janthinobacterium sp.]
MNGFVQALGWTLLHFLWQGILIGCATALAWAAMRNARPEAHYALGCGALLACLCWPLVGLSLRLASGDAASPALAGPRLSTTLLAPDGLPGLHTALSAVQADIQGLIQRSQAKAIREIFITHQEMLDDPELTDEVDTRLKQGESAEAAWMAVIDAAARQQESLQDALLAERAADLRDIGRRVLAQLCGIQTPSEPDQPYILVMDEVGPSDVARLDPTRVAGILTARGGATAHSAIVARALGIPALVGAGAAVLLLAPGTSLLLDAQRGRLHVDADAATLQRASEERDTREQRLKAAAEQRHQPAVTRDGHAVEVFANIGESAGVTGAVEQGAEGIGLLRTELIFMAHPQLPDEATQEVEYRRVLDGLAGRPLVVRTLDVGGDKPLPYWPIAKEENPFLGVRGIRLTLQRPQVMEAQLRALLRAADNRPLRI